VLEAWRRAERLYTQAEVEAAIARSLMKLAKVVVAVERELASRGYEVSSHGSNINPDNPRDPGYIGARVRLRESGVGQLGFHVWIPLWMETGIPFWLLVDEHTRCDMAEPANLCCLLEESWSGGEPVRHSRGHFLPVPVDRAGDISDVAGRMVERIIGLDRELARRLRDE